jgi:hypothetical protein
MRAKYRCRRAAKFHRVQVDVPSGVRVYSNLVHLCVVFWEIFTFWFCHNFLNICPIHIILAPLNLYWFSEIYDVVTNWLKSSLLTYLWDNIQKLSDKNITYKKLINNFLMFALKLFLSSNSSWVRDRSMGDKKIFKSCKKENLLSFTMKAHFRTL